MLCVRRLQRSILTRIINMAEMASNLHDDRQHIPASLASSVIIRMRSSQQNVTGNDLCHINPKALESLR